MKISNKLKGVLCILMAMLSAFTYGLYFCGTVSGRVNVEWYQWTYTGLFGIMWVVWAYDYLTKAHKDEY